MGAFVGTLNQYVDFLVLGAFTIAVLSLPFGFMTPLTAGWQWLSEQVRDSDTWIQVGLIAGVLFAAFYFAGYAVNALGHAFLHRAHYSIINNAATLAQQEGPEQSGANPIANQGPANGPRRDFIWRVLPLFGPLFHVPEPDELRNYENDARKQVYWDICDPNSSEDMLGGGVLRELRLLRGAIGVTQILLPLCLVGLALSRTRFRCAKSQGRWSLGTLVFAPFVYLLVIVPGYWDVEYEEHSTIWAAFPPSLDPLTADKLDSFLPCVKMKMIAAGKKDDKKETGQGNGQPESPASPPILHQRGD